MINKIQFVYMKLQEALNLLEHYNNSNGAQYKDIVETQKDVYRLRREYMNLMNDRA